MKRALRRVFSGLVIGAVVTAAAWAQDEDGGVVQVGNGTLKISGFVKSGVKAEANNLNKIVGKGQSEQEVANKQAYAHQPQLDSDGNVKDDPLWFTPFNDNEGVPFRAQVQLDYSTETAGASVRLRGDMVGSHTLFDGTNVDTTPFNAYVAHAYGWFGLLGNIVEVSGGFLNNGKWGTFTDFHIDDSLDNKNGVKLEIKPIEGLSLGINTIYLNPLANGGAGLEADDVFKRGVYGIKYAVPETFGIAAEFVGYSEQYYKIWTKNINQPPRASGTPDPYAAITKTDFGTLFSAYFYGVPNLALDLDGTFATYKQEVDQNGKKVDDVTSAFGLALQGIYTLDALSAGLKATVGTFSNTLDGNGKSQFDLVLTPKAAYKITEWFTAGLEIPVGIVENQSGVGDTKVEDWKGGFEIGVKPKLTFDVGGGATLAVFYLLDVYTPGHFTKVFGNDVKSPEAKVTHTVQLDFIWKF